MKHLLSLIKEPFEITALFALIVPEADMPIRETSYYLTEPTIILFQKKIFSSCVMDVKFVYLFVFTGPNRQNHKKVQRNLIQQYEIL